jgi:hypothetical protein
MNNLIVTIQIIIQTAFLNKYNKIFRYNIKMVRMSNKMALNE